MGRLWRCSSGFRQEAIAGAHTSPVVLELWKRFEAVCSYETPSKIAEFRNLFAHFEAI